MNTVFPIMIIVTLGAAAGAVFHHRSSHFWLASLRAGLAAGIVWVAGVYLLLWLTAPNELVPPLPTLLLETYMTAFLPAILVGWAMRLQRGRGIACATRR